MPVFGASLFVSAFLLFLVQPMFTKMALPMLGGSPQVWNVSVVFYQGVLLLGYLYAHLTRTYVPTRWAAAIQLVLLAAVPLFMPIHIPPGWQPPSGSGSALWLLLLLSVSVGIPFFVLSTTSPLIQAWFADSGHREAGNPYFLYAASNVGSLAGLLVYPFVLEPAIGVSRQTWLWAIGYGVLVPLMLACIWIAWTSSIHTSKTLATLAVQTKTSWIGRLRWIALTFVPSSLMLGVTAHLSNVVAPIPLLWSLPLALYLLTFVIVFARRPPSELLILRILPYCVLPVVFLLVVQMRLPLLPYLTVNLVAFFALALACHSRLASSRPPHERLTEFYLCLSIGGVLGGIFNTFIAPAIFPDLGEYALGIVLACFATGVLGWKKRSFIAWDFAIPVLVAASFAIALALFNMDARLVAAVALLGAFATYGRSVRFALTIGGLLFAGALLIHPYGDAIFGARNFFGIKWVLNDEATDYHLLIHSGTLHGIQSREPSRLREPLAYYSREGPLGQAMRSLASSLKGRSIAVIGLGAGSAACYARPDERWTFYEIDPQVVAIAEDARYFSFLSLCAPQARVVLGDARLALASQSSGQNAAMILDAYSADTVPTHLLTVEALDVYLKHLTPDGVLLFNISNQYFDLRPVLGNLASSRGLLAYFQSDSVAERVGFGGGRFGSRWVVMSRRIGSLASIANDARWSVLGPNPNIPLWTDDYSSLIRVLNAFVK